MWREQEEERGFVLIVPSSRKKKDKKTTNEEAAGEREKRESDEKGREGGKEKGPGLCVCVAVLVKRRGRGETFNIGRRKKNHSIGATKSCTCGFYFLVDSFFVPFLAYMDGGVACLFVIVHWLLLFSICDNAPLSSFVSLCCFSPLPLAPTAHT